MNNSKIDKTYVDLLRDGIFRDMLGKQVFKGILSEHIAYAGPAIVQLDLTNNCNLNCVGCWCHSDLMQNLKFSSEKKKIHLSLPVVKKLINELKELGVKEIQLSGSGDPTMYPYFTTVLEDIKKAGLNVHIITNFTMMSKEYIDKIIELGIEKITISMWAGDEKTYLKTHPNQSKNTFYRMIKNLKYLHSVKKINNLPYIRVYNVISSLNYDNIQEMVDFAIDTFADSVEFQIIDIVPGKSEKLMLNQKMVEKIVEQFESLKNYTSYYDDLSGIGKNPEFKDFGRFSKRTLPYGFVFDKITNKVRCSKEYFSQRKKPNKNRSKLDSFLYDFSSGLCEVCDIKFDCYSKYPFQVDFLTLLGHGSFYRRLHSIKKNRYDINIVDTIPCHIGWTYTRILPNGDVIPCCKAHKKPLGNLNKNSFKEIWVSEKYNKFRYMAKTQKKSHLYFKEIECYKSCDNLGMNLETEIHLNHQL